ncbi:sensor histidine kinase [Bifidobacterium bifidum]|uniref:sensor histidine kinase n=1 Tax=Bifidobacterium bifidum TaxID=1681 RepID=UPI00344F530A
MYRCRSCAAVMARGRPRPECPRLYPSRFPRDDDGTAHQGYGLGLALARDVANRYGGSVAVESSSPSGTTMLLSFPLA